MLRRLLWLCLGSAAGCSPVEDSNGSEVPGEIRRALDQPTAEAGRLHIVQRGRFDIVPATLFCLRFDAGVGFDGAAIVRALTAMRQPAYHAGSPRVVTMRANPACAAAGNVTVFTKLATAPNSRGYRVAVAAWQGGAEVRAGDRAGDRSGHYKSAAPTGIWVGVIPRDAGAPRPIIFNPYGTDAKSIEIVADVTSLSRALSRFVVARGVK